MEKVKQAEAGTGALGRADEPGAASGVVIVLLGETGTSRRTTPGSVRRTISRYLTGVELPACLG